MGDSTKQHDRQKAVQNQEINFQRTREQDTSVSLTQPLYDARISAGRMAAQSQYEAQSAARIALAGRIERDGVHLALA